MKKKTQLEVEVPTSETRDDEVVRTPVSGTIGGEPTMTPND